MTTKIKILIGILMVGIILVGGFWIWNEYQPIEERKKDEISREELNKKISDKIKKLDKSCLFDGDCKTVELLRLIQTNGAYPFCVNKGEVIKEIRCLQDLYYKKYKASLPNILISPAPFYGCECKNNICTEISEKR